MVLPAFTLNIARASLPAGMVSFCVALSPLESGPAVTSDTVTVVAFFSVLLTFTGSVSSSLGLRKRGAPVLMTTGSATFMFSEAEPKASPL